MNEQDRSTFFGGEAPPENNLATLQEGPVREGVASVSSPTHGLHLAPANASKDHFTEYELDQVKQLEASKHCLSPPRGLNSAPHDGKAVHPHDDGTFWFHDETYGCTSTGRTIRKRLQSGKQRSTRLSYNFCNQLHFMNEIKFMLRLKERFMSSIEIRDGHWFWIGRLDPKDGYGLIWVGDN